jgi:hypothetical protein
MALPIMKTGCRKVALFRVVWVGRIVTGKQKPFNVAVLMYDTALFV